MRTHVELDPIALEQVMQLGQYPSKKAALNAALQALAMVLKRQQLLALQGSIPWVGDLAQLRENRDSGVPA
jgi:Arc/MetJ family transcription regulator